MAYMYGAKNAKIEEKADEMIVVMKKLIELEKFFNSKVTSRTSLNDLIDGNSEEAKEYRELLKDYAILYDYIGKYQPALLKKLLKEYEENSEHIRFTITLKREKRLNDNNIEKIEDYLKDLRDEMDDYILKEYIKQMAEEEKLKKFDKFYQLEKLWKKNDEIERTRKKYKEQLAKLKKIDDVEHNRYVEYTKGWFENRLHKYNIEIEKEQDNLECEQEKQKDLELEQNGEEKKEDSFFENLFGFLLGDEDYYEEEKQNEELDLSEKLKKDIKIKS